jgi:hypothetical protein
MGEAQAALLQDALSAAVPLWILELRQSTFEQRAALAAKACDVIASQGDIILYRSSKKGETAKAFNELAKGLAVLAYQPGGVEIFGLHFCVNHDECLAAINAAPEDN